MLVCKCGSADTIETRTARFFVNGKVRGGTKQIRCYHCGEILV